MYYSKYFLYFPSHKNAFTNINNIFHDMKGCVLLHSEHLDFSIFHNNIIQYIYTYRHLKKINLMKNVLNEHDNSDNFESEINFDMK